MLAMLFLILFSILALGFYSMVTTSQQVAGSEQRVAHAFTAAESGMEFMRYELSRVIVPSGTDEDGLIDAVYADLQVQLNGTPNMGGTTVGLSGGVISIPSGSTEYITLDGNSKFRATIRRNPTAPTNELIVHCVGVYGSKNATRAIEMRFKPQIGESEWFSYAMASAGGIKVSKGTVTDTSGLLAGLMTTYAGTPAMDLEGGIIQGEIAVTGSTSQVDLGGTSVAGTTDSATILAEHTHIVPAPSLPTFDTSPFAAYATNTWTSSMNTPFINCRVPAASNPSFKQGDVIKGILYIESPNTVEFKGDVTIEGFIIFENTGTDSVNTMEFKGGAEVLPLPSDSEFDALRAIGGIAIMAPTAAVEFKGDAATDLVGSVVVSKLTTGGNSDLTITNGSFIVTSNSATAMDLGGKSITFNGNGALNPPTLGVMGDQRFQPQPRTYLEVSP